MMSVARTCEAEPLDAPKFIQLPTAHEYLAIEAPVLHPRHGLKQAGRKWP